MVELDLKSAKSRNEIAKQYQALVHKIVNQQIHKTALSPADVLGFAEEGLVDAMNTYNPNKGQTFRQYAGYRILYAIQNGSNTQGHTVTFSAYMQKKAKENDQSTWIMRSIDIHVDEDGEEHSNIPIPSCEMNVTTTGDVYQDLYDLIESKFSQRDCEIFYQIYGINGREVKKGKDLAAEYGCSGTNITLINQKVLKYIRSQKELAEQLLEVFNA